jgi:hypothetical protein
MFDVETLGVESNAVVLSAGLIHFDPDLRPTYQDLLDNACFVKFDVKEQLAVGRTVSKSTLGWWKDQHEYTRKVSLDPSRDDMTVENGVKQLQDYMAKFPNADKQTMWARGSLDQLVIDSLAWKKLQGIICGEMSELQSISSTELAMDMLRLITHCSSDTKLSSTTLFTTAHWTQCN